MPRPFEMFYSDGAMHGLHLTADRHQCRCDPTRLVDAPGLGASCLAAVQASGLSAVAHLFHVFERDGPEPSGVTAVILLAESHLCVHTWPELRSVTLDVYVCNYGADHSTRAHALMDARLALFEPNRVERHTLHRGQALAPAAAPAPARS